MSIRRTRMIRLKEPRLDHLTRESITHRDEVAQLRQQMVELDQKLKAAKDDAQERDQALDLAVMRRAQNEAKELVGIMVRVLPRELCEMVYSYLAFREGVQYASKVFVPPANPPPPPPLGPPPYAQPPPFHFYLCDVESAPAPEYVPPDERIFNPDFVDETTASEVTKAYYRVNSFSVRAHRGMHCLRRLLEYDRAGLNIKPATLIRRLQIEIPVDTCEAQRRRRMGIANVNSDAGTQACLREHTTCLSTCLAMIPEGHLKQMEIRFVMQCDQHICAGQNGMKQERKFLNMLYDIRGSIYMLKRHGSKVSIFGQVYTGSRVDISHLFPLSMEEISDNLATPYIPYDAIEDGAPLGDQSSEISLQDARLEWGYESFKDLILFPSLEGKNNWGPMPPGPPSPPRPHPSQLMYPYGYAPAPHWSSPSAP